MWLMKYLSKKFIENGKTTNSFKFIVIVYCMQYPLVLKESKNFFRFFILQKYYLSHSIG